MTELAEAFAAATGQDYTAKAPWDDAGLRSHQRLAARFAQYASSKCLFVHGAGWHYWDGARWAPDDLASHAHALLTQLLQLSWAEAMSDKELAADVKAGNTATGSTGILDLASRRMFAKTVDADPYLLNCANGTLDLHTLELRPHDPADRITKVTRAAYVPDAGGAAWLGFLETSLPDVDVREFLQRYAGLALIGRVIEHVLVIATGTGRNGKGVMSRMLSKALGDYAVTASNDLLIAGRYGHKSAGELASQMVLRGARWAEMSELDKGAKMAESTMKTLTGGDTITAKYMTQNYVQFEPSHSFFMLTNDLPAVDADAEAVWARICAVPFDVSFKGREDPHLEQRIEAELDAVLAWAVAGLFGYQQEGLNAPAAVQARTNAYRDENDPIAQFMADECVTHPNANVTKADFASAYAQWAHENREAPFSPRAIGIHMKNVPGVKESNSGTRKWVGIGMKDENRK